MKKFNIIIVLFISLIIVSFQSQEISSPKLFVGYRYEYPVFDDVKAKVLYVLKDSLQTLFKYNTTYSVKAVIDEIFCFEEKVKDAFNIVVIKNGVEKKYSVNTRLTYAAIDKNGMVFFTDTKADNAIKSITNNEIKDLGIKGYVVSWIDNCLYYSKEHDPNLDYANADIFEFDILSRHDQKLLSNVSGESTYILPNRMYIYDKILLDGIFQPILYSLDQKKYKLLNVEKKYLNQSPFYSYQTNDLVFYNSKTMDEKFVEIPLDFDLKR